MLASRLKTELEKIENAYHAKSDRAYKDDTARNSYGAAKVWPVSPLPFPDNSAYGFSTIGLGGNIVDGWMFELIMVEVATKRQTRAKMWNLLEYLEGRMSYFYEKIINPSETGIIATRLNIAKVSAVEYDAVDRSMGVKIDLIINGDI